MRSFLFGAVLGAFGAVWAMGALPEQVENFLNDKVCELAEKAGISLGGSDGDAAGTSATSGAGSATGSDGEMNSAEVAAAAAELRYAGVFEAGHLIEVYTCPVMEISNRPADDEDGRILNFKPLVDVNGATIAAAPVSHGCLSSGFGPRNGGHHKGVDYHSEEESHVYSAGEGTIVEKVTRDDFGNMVIVDHGNGVYTRYAHLKNFASGVSEGKSVSGTTRLGEMGNTASYRVPIHLHYELLQGDYNTPKKSFGLEPMDPYDLFFGGHNAPEKPSDLEPKDPLSLQESK